MHATFMVACGLLSFGWTRVIYHQVTLRHLQNIGRDSRSEEVGVSLSLDKAGSDYGMLPMILRYFKQMRNIHHHRYNIIEYYLCLWRNHHQGVKAADFGLNSRASSHATAV